MKSKSAPLKEHNKAAHGEFVELNTSSVANIVSWSPKSDALLLCARSGLAHLFSDDGVMKWRVQAHAASILKASWNYDGTLIATSGVDGKCKIWRASDGQMLLEMDSEHGWIEHLAWSPLLPLLLTASSTRISLWTDMGKLVDELNWHGWPITNLSWHPTMRDTFASCAADGIRIWKLACSAPVHSLTGCDYPERLAFNRSGTVLAFGASDGSAQVWTMGSGIVLKAKTGIRGLSGMDWSWGGQWLAFSGEHEAFLWNISDQSPRTAKPEKLLGCFGHLKYLQFHTYEHLLASADDDGSVQIWRTDRKDRLMPISMCHYDFSVSAMDWNPLCRRLAIAYANGAARIWSSDFKGATNEKPEELKHADRI